MTTPSPQATHETFTPVRLRAGLHAEWLKYRRTAALWLPSIVSLLVVGVSATSAPDAKTLLMMLQILWLTAWLPLACALAAGMNADLESRTGAWRVLRARATPPVVLYVAKLLFVFLTVLASSVVMIVSATALGVTLHSDTQPFAVGTVVQLAVTGTLVSIPLVLLHLWLAIWRGLGVSLLVGFLGLMLVQPAGPIWPFVPWTWFGKLSSVSSSNPSTWMVLLVIAIWTALAAWWTLRWFSKRDDT